MIESIRERIKKELDDLPIERQKFINELFGVASGIEKEQATAIILKFIQWVGKQFQPARGRVIGTRHYSPTLDREQTLDVLRVRFLICKLPEDILEQLIKLIDDAIVVVLSIIPENSNILTLKIPQKDQDAINEKFKVIVDFIDEKVPSLSIKYFIGKEQGEMFDWGTGAATSDNCEFPAYYMNKNSHIDYVVEKELDEKINKVARNTLSREDSIIDLLKDEILEEFGQFILKNVDLEPAVIKTFNEIAKENVYGDFMTLIAHMFDKKLAGVDVLEEMSALHGLLKKHFLAQPTSICDPLDHSQAARNRLAKNIANSMNQETFDKIWQEISNFVYSKDFEEEIKQAFVLRLRDKIFTEVSDKQCHEVPDTIQLPNVIMYKGMGYWNNIGPQSYFKTPEQVLKEGLLPPEGKAAKFTLAHFTEAGNSHSPNLGVAIKFANYNKGDSGWIVIDVISKGLNVVANPKGSRDEDEFAVPFVFPNQIIGMIKIERVVKDNNIAYYLVDYLKNSEFNLPFSYDQTYEALAESIQHFTEMGGREKDACLDITYIVEKFDNIHASPKNTKGEQQIPVPSLIKERFFGVKKLWADYDNFKETHQKKWENYRQSAQKKISPVALATKITKKEREHLFQTVAPHADASLHEHARYIIFYYYQSSDDPVIKSYRGSYQNLDFRVRHGGMHVGRTALSIPMIISLYRQYGDLDALSLSQEDIKLLQIAALFHDSGRLDDFANDTKESEERSALNCYTYLKEVMNVPEQKARDMSQAISGKDKPLMEKNIYEKILYDADCFEVLRADDWVFSHIYLDFYKIHKENPAAIETLYQYIDEYKLFLTEMGDSPRKHTMLTNSSQSIKENFNLAIKRHYEKSIHCYAFMEAELLKSSFLRNLYESGIQNGLMPILQ